MNTSGTRTSNTAAVEMLADGPYEVSFAAHRIRSPAHGLFGGLPGSSGESLMNGGHIDIRGMLDIVAGDRLMIRTPGGGGYGALLGAAAPR